MKPLAIEVRKNSQIAVNKQHAPGIDPRPILGRNVVISNHTSLPRIHPGHSACDKITDLMKQVSRRKPDRHARGELLSHKERDHEHHQSQPGPKGQTVRPTGVSGYEGKVRVQQVRTSPEESQEQNFTIREDTIPLLTLINALDETRRDDWKEGVGDGIHRQSQQVAGRRMR